MSTLAVSSRMIFATIHKNNDGILKQDKRGRHGNYGNAVNEEIKNGMRLHIKSFPTTPSHYCRVISSRIFYMSTHGVPTTSSLSAVSLWI